MKIKKFLKMRVIILLFFILISIIAINPKFNAEGVAIKGVEKNSTAALAGITYSSDTTPTNLERIIAINSQDIKNIEDYNNILGKINNSEVIRVKTDKNDYAMIKTEHLGISISEVQKNNLKKGLDLQGGTRVVLEPDEKLTDQEFDDLVGIMGNRLNVYGLIDIKIRQSKDLFGDNFIIAEVAGASKQEVEELISSQGKFEAKIGNETVFIGGEKDITSVCRADGTCSGIRQCLEIEGGFQCQFEFSIKLSEEAAKRHAQITDKLDVNISAAGNNYLSLPLDLYLDNNLVDSLQISEDLKGRETLDIAISGPGIGSTEDDAKKEAISNMNKLQTVLITGSLPVKLNIVKIDTISPTLGKAFFNNAITIFVVAIIAVLLIVFIRYRDLKISLPIILISLSEIFITLGVLVLLGTLGLDYNLDLAGVAGIIAAVGTGVTDQIIIADEISKGKKEHVTNFKDKIKRAFFVILVSWGAGVVSMLPLLFTGAGLLKGFALTTIIGVSVGVFITRPAFASIVENLEED
ncbi:MAG: hypothetical protein AABW56_01610 [Nanoarchaeota archaeon]